MSKGLSNVLKEIEEMKEQGYCGTTQIMEMMKLAELRRIADEMSAINMTLLDMQRSWDALQDCVAESDNGCFLRITGNVTNYEG